jgi:hypothetical protein
VSRTRRSRPTSKESKAQRLEREWEQKVAHEHAQAQSREEIAVPAVHIQQQPELIALPPHVEAIRQEAEVIANQRMGTPLPVSSKARKPQPYSVQSPATDILLRLVAVSSGGQVVISLNTSR